MNGAAGPRLAGAAPPASWLPGRSLLCQMLPNLIIIGARKCGTTSLHHYLDQHPEIAMSRPKELNFFNSVDWRSKLDWYRGKFTQPAKVRGEGTPAYSAYPTNGVVERMHELIPEAKLMYLVGDPVRRIEAQWVQWYAGEVDRCSTVRFPGLAARPLSELLRDFRDPDNPYVAASRYGTQLERYLAFFDPEQVLVVDQDNLRKQRTRTLCEIFRFLEVDDGFQSEAFSSELNLHREKRRTGTRYARVRQAALRVGLERFPSSVRAPIARPLRRAFSRPVPRPVVDEEIRPGLLAHLHDEVERLRELTGQQFPGWSV